MMGKFTPKTRGKRELAEAEQFVREQKFDKAISKAKEGLREYRDSGTSREIAYANGKILEFQAKKHEQNEKLESASATYKQSARYYKRAGRNRDQERVLNNQITILMRIGQEKSKNHEFTAAATYYEKAAISLKENGKKIRSLETRAKAFVFRAASTNEPADRKSFLKEAVRLFEDSGIENPVIQGHVDYYSAMIERLSNPNKAIQLLDSAILYYEKANNMKMMANANELKKQLIKKSDIMKER